MDCPVTRTASSGGGSRWQLTRSTPGITPSSLLELAHQVYLWMTLVQSLSEQTNILAALTTRNLCAMQTQTQALGKLAFAYGSSGPSYAHAYFHPHDYC